MGMTGGVRPPSCPPMADEATSFGMREETRFTVSKSRFCSVEFKFEIHHAMFAFVVDLVGGFKCDAGGWVLRCGESRIDQCSSLHTFNSTLNACKVW